MSRQSELAELSRVYDSSALSNRNVIVNGAMQCWQRATAATAAANGYNTVDRFKFYKNTGAFTTERSDDHPHGAGYSLKAQCTTADTSLSAGDYAFIDSELEGQTLQHFQYGASTAKNITLSFWVKSNKTGIYTSSVYKHAGSGTGYMYRKEFTISAADTWEKKTITVSPTAGSTSLITASAGAIPNTNVNGIGITFNFAMGSTFHGANDTWETGGKYGTSNQVNWLDSTSNNFYITEIQMEVGTEATPFEHRSFGQELALCQRYFCRTYGYGTATGAADTSQGCISTVSETAHNYASAGNFNFPVEMRAAPSVTLYSTYNANTTGKVTADATDGTGSAGFIAASRCFIHRANDSSGVGANVLMRAHAIASAEL